MMYPAQSEPTNRSALEPHPNQAQQLLYAPYNPIQACTQPTTQSQCIYVNAPQNSARTVSLRSQGEPIASVKTTRWHVRPRSVRVKEHFPQSNVPPLQFPPPPLMIFDPGQPQLPASAPLTPVYLNQTPSCYNPNAYATEYNSYSSNNPSNVISQAYFKPLELQTFRLVPEQQQSTKFVQQQAINSFYNTASNLNIQKSTCQLASADGYAISASNDGRIQSAIASTHGLVSNPPEKTTSSLLISANAAKTFLKQESEGPELFGLCKNEPNVKCDVGRRVKSPQDERLPDESSNFDFTIEAEKMVSALCNIEADRDEQSTPKPPEMRSGQLEKDDSSLDEVKKTFKPWYLGDSRNSNKPTATQTDIAESPGPELIRKLVFHGCNEAEMILKTATTFSTREKWLLSLSNATKIALTKSSTSFPVYSSDKNFALDLICSLLRVSNGWLALDHYLNKQHNPPLSGKYDNALIESFKTWEASTYDLLGHIIKSFIKLDTNSEHNESANTMAASFPGDVSLYVNFDAFADQIAPAQYISQVQTASINPLGGLNHSLYCSALENRDQRRMWSESKLRTKWTIAEQAQYNDKDWKILTHQDHCGHRAPLVNHSGQQKLQYNLFLPQNDGNSVDMTVHQPAQIFLRRLDAQPLVQRCPGVDNAVPTMTGGQRASWNSAQASICSAFQQSDVALCHLDNKVTGLLGGEIESKRCGEVKNSTESETINLSAWFATMRQNRDSTSSVATPSWWASATSVTSKTRESKSSLDLGTSKMDINRQLRTLKNMRTIQSAPWTANHLLQECSTPRTLPQDEPDSSEDARVYMKPGSYNVPKKKCQSRRSYRRDSSRPKSNQTQNDTPERDDDDGSRDLMNNGSSSSSISSQDTTWKAACASAELFLDALKVKEAARTSEINSGKVLDQIKPGNRLWAFGNQVETSPEQVSRGLSSKNDSRSCQLFSFEPKTSARDGNNIKTNVKTDSWLIQTLNNVAEEVKNNSENGDRRDTESPTPIITEINGETNVVAWKPLDQSMSEEEGPSYSVETSHRIAVMALVDVVGKATYSETVRRFTTKSSCLNTLSQRTQDNAEVKSVVTTTEEEPMECKKQESPKAMATDPSGKSQKTKSHSGDRSWSVWSSTKKKQNNSYLGPVAMGKLVSIHRALWRMDVSRVLKSPSKKKSSNSEIVSVKNYRKDAKNPLYLETIGYKLKNHFYKKPEHGVRDFRKILHNSRLHYKNNKECIEKIEALSRKFEELVEQHFGEESQQNDCSTAVPAEGSMLDGRK